MVEEAAPRGLTVYLGAAPGEGRPTRCSARRSAPRAGTDVVIGYVETHGREHTIEQLEGLSWSRGGDRLPRHDVHRDGHRRHHRAASRPWCCVDELAHTNVPGSPHEKRAEDIEEIRAAGIDVITTVNIQHLESLNDEVERITGVRQRETVPDEVVRTADQIQLVDMSPQALRRRMAHGNIYSAEQIDASLTSYFRVGNLTALRELALLWLADRVDDALDDYRRAHGSSTRGRPRSGSSSRYRRARERDPAPPRRPARPAGRRVRTARGARGRHRRPAPTPTTPDRRGQQLVESLGGPSTRSSERTSPRQSSTSRPARTPRWSSSASPGTVGCGGSSPARRVSGSPRSPGPIDVHLVTHDRWPARRSACVRSHRLSRGGRPSAGASPCCCRCCSRSCCTSLDETDQLPLDMLLFLAGTVLVALVGGMLPALLAAARVPALNWFFTPPVGRFTVAEPTNLVALLVFVGVAVGVATVVDRASRRASEAARARAEAATLASLSRSVLTGQDTAEAIVERLRETFGQDAVSLLAAHRRRLERWRLRGGRAPARRTRPTPGSRWTTTTCSPCAGRPARHGPARAGGRSRCRPAWCWSTAGCASATTGRPLLERAEATSTAILRAVSHDLRTPLATMRAAVDGLVTGGRPRPGGPERAASPPSTRRPTSSSG